MDPEFALELITKKHKKKNKDLFVGFMDLEKPYDKYFVSLNFGKYRMKQINYLVK